MKKSLFMLGLAVAAMTSCSNDELMEVNTNNVITFESHVNKGTRAVTPTADLTKFYVFGYHNGATGNVVFNNVNVDGTMGGSWSYDDADNDLVAWTANTYKFAAYANKNSSDKLSSVTFADGKLTIPGFTASDATDLVAAVSGNITPSVGGSNAAVDLTFKHMLSKVYFVLTNNSPEGYKMQVSNITFDVLPSGNCVYDGTNAVWTPSGTATELEFTEGSNTDIAFNDARTTEERLVIPNQSLKDIRASFTVSFYDADGNKVDEKAYNNVTIKLDSTGDNTWQPGYVYKYTASISSDTDYIVFNVTPIDGWKNATPNPVGGLN